jgi:hypothetical protein
MTTINVTIKNIDREELRLITAALRDKRDQMLATQERERQKSLNEGRQTDLTVGEQAHRMATIINELKQAYQNYPMPSVTCEVVA